MKKTNYLKIAFAIIAIVFAALYFTKPSLKTTLTDNELKIAEELALNNPQYFIRNPKFHKPVPAIEVPDALRRVRELNLATIKIDTSWTTYSRTDFNDYLDKYDSAIRVWEGRYSNVYDGSKYNWTIGLYPYLKENGGKKFVDFYVIPTLKDELTKVAYNMVDSIRLKKGPMFSEIEGFIYNFGDLHP